LRAYSFSSAVTANGARACAVSHGRKSTIVFLPKLPPRLLRVRNDKLPMASRVVQEKTRHATRSPTNVSRRTILVLPNMRRRIDSPREGAIGGVAIDILLQETGVPVFTDLVRLPLPAIG
jgi:hypothetical protein